MFYDIPDFINNKQTPQWPNGIGNIKAILTNGNEINLPVYNGMNVLTVGVVGTGKTRSYTLPASEILLNSNPRMKSVFFEIKNSFIDHFMETNDKVITQNPNSVPYDNLFKPNIIKEIRQSADPEGEICDISTFLFREILDNSNQNRSWIEAAQDTFMGILRVIVDCYPTENTTNWTLVNALRNMPTANMLSYLAKHPRNHSMLIRDWGFDPKKNETYTVTRRANDIQFFFNRALEKFSGAFELNGEDTIHDWLNSKYGRHIFFFYDLASAESSRPFFLYYLKKIKDFKLSNTAKSTAPILMVLDEIDKMTDNGKAADWGLFQAANLGREYGLQLLVTTQSIENLYGLSSNFNEHNTVGGLAGFPYIISFRPGDPSTIQTLQTLYGSEYKEHIVMPASRYSELQVKCELEPIVTDSDFASLGTGDCIVKIASSRPQKIHIDFNHS